MSRILKIDFSFHNSAIAASRIPYPERLESYKIRSLNELSKGIKDLVEWEETKLPDRINYRGQVHVIKVSDMREVIVKLKELKNLYRPVESDEINEIIKILNP